VPSSFGAMCCARGGSSIASEADKALDFRWLGTRHAAAGHHGLDGRVLRNLAVTRTVTVFKSGRILTQSSIQRPSREARLRGLGCPRFHIGGVRDFPSILPDLRVDAPMPQGRFFAEERLRVTSATVARAVRKLMAEIVE